MGCNQSGLIPPSNTAVKHPALNVSAAPSLPSLCLPNPDRKTSLVYLIKHLLPEALALIQGEGD